eukprot:COSAG01_NODE_3243_length_6366_cov_53.945588_8_plen_219_part_00
MSGLIVVLMHLAAYRCCARDGASAVNPTHPAADALLYRPTAHQQLPANPWPSLPDMPCTQLPMRCRIDPLRSNCGRARRTCRARSCRCVAVPTCHARNAADGTSSCQRIRGRARQTHHAPSCRCVAVLIRRAATVAEPARHTAHAAADALLYRPAAHAVQLTSSTATPTSRTALRFCPERSSVKSCIHRLEFYSGCAAWYSSTAVLVALQYGCIQSRL